MNKIFVTSDHHFGHKNIIEYADRPFKSVEEMDDYMVKMWNERVDWNDTVYHLGDFTLCGLNDAIQYFKRLNGNIIVLSNPWHHDRRWLPMKKTPMIVPYLESKTESCVRVTLPILLLEKSETGLPKPIVLCHYEMAKWDRSHYGSWHFYGHDHVKFAPYKQKMNVGVDAHSFCPLDVKILSNYLVQEGY